MWEPALGGRLSIPTYLLIYGVINWIWNVHFHFVCISIDYHHPSNQCYINAIRLKQGSGNTGFLVFHLCFSSFISCFIVCFLFHPIIFVTLNQSGWKSHLSGPIYQEEPAMLIKFIHQLCQETHQQMIFTHVTLWHYLSSQKYQKDKIWQPEIFTLIDCHWCFQAH